MSAWTKTTQYSTILLLLAACGGSNPNAPLISAEEEALRVFADTDGDGIDDQDTADVLSRGDTLVSRGVGSATWVEMYPDGELTGGYTSTDGVVSLQGDGDDLLVTFPDGTGGSTTVRIVDAASINDGQVRIENDDIFFDFYVNNRDIADLLDGSVGSGYHHVVGIYYNDRTENFGVQSEAIIGAETQDAMIDELGMTDTIATYDAFGAINIRRDDATWPTFNARLDGDMTLTADFGAATIDGEMTNLFFRENAGNTEVDAFDVGGSILLNETAIQANAFAGTMSADADLIADDPAIAELTSGVGYSGAFYGPVAQQIGGTFQGSGEFDGQGYLMQGAFAGDAIE